MSVVEPPRMVAKLSVISTWATGTRFSRARPARTGINITTTGVLLRKADRPAAATTTTAMVGQVPSRAERASHRVGRSRAPVW